MTRVLFLNEGNLGSHIMGQGQLEEALRTGLRTVPELEARFVTLPTMGPLAGRIASQRVPLLANLDLDLRTLRWHGVQAWRARSLLARELRAWPADAVHVHSHSIGLAMGHRVPGVPLALSVDTTVTDWWEMPAWRLQRAYAPLLIAPSRALERRVLRKAAIVFAWTAWARRSCERVAPGAHVVEHHPGIDLQRYRPAERRERVLPRVLFVGGRFLEKGGSDLLEALAEQLGRTVELDLVTSYPVEPRPGVTVHSLRPSDPKLLELHQQADVFCLPTHGDAAPWAVLEAMSSGTPVVATRVGGIPDMLEDGHAGVLLEHGDPVALGQALQELLANEPLRVQLAARARQRVERCYDAKAQVSSLFEHLRALAPAPTH